MHVSGPDDPAVNVICPSGQGWQALFSTSNVFSGHTWQKGEPGAEISPPGHE